MISYENLQKDIENIMSQGQSADEVINDINDGLERFRAMKLIKIKKSKKNHISSYRSYLRWWWSQQSYQVWIQIGDPAFPFQREMLRVSQIQDPNVW